MKEISALKEEYRPTLKHVLLSATTCDIQHDGWTCGTCFFAINKELTNQHWQTTLLIRGDSTFDELNNLPEDLEQSIKDVIEYAEDQS